MRGQKALFSRASNEWETPDSLFKQLDQEFHFECDAAATEENHKCNHYFSKEGLSAIELNTWGGKIYNTFFLNPPYSLIAKFMKKAYEEAVKGATVVCLIPARTDTRYWHEYCMKASEIRLIKGRLKFDNRTLPSWRSDGSHKTSSATFPSAVIIFDERMTRINHEYPKLVAMEVIK
jgi:site-specific DNA-methyltransferase (adenine-specific)